MAKEKSYIVCPVCVHNLPVERGGRSRRKYNIWSKEKDSTVYLRDCRGGKKMDLPSAGAKRGRGWRPGSGFPIVKRLSWKEALDKAEYTEVLQEIQEQIQKLAVEILDQNQKKELIKKMQETKE